jgi:hypothetical protein
MTRRFIFGFALLAAFTLALAGCAGSSSKGQTDMDRTEARAQAITILHAAGAPVDSSGWVVESNWMSCTDIADQSVRYTILATRRGPLPGSAKATIEAAARSLTRAGFEVRAQHEPTSNLWAVGYPNGFLGGRAADGSGFEVTARDDFYFINIDGHCVPGDVPKDPDDPLRATPSPFAAAPVEDPDSARY